MVRRTATGYRTRETRQQIPGRPHKRKPTFGNTGKTLSQFNRDNYLAGGFAQNNRSKPSPKIRRYPRRGG